MQTGWNFRGRILDVLPKIWIGGQWYFKRTLILFVFYFICIDKFLENFPVGARGGYFWTPLPPPPGPPLPLYRRLCSPMVERCWNEMEWPLRSLLLSHLLALQGTIHWSSSFQFCSNENNFLKITWKNIFINGTFTLKIFL